MRPAAARRLQDFAKIAAAIRFAAATDEVTAPCRSCSRPGGGRPFFWSSAIWQRQSGRGSPVRQAVGADGLAGGSSRCGAASGLRLRCLFSGLGICWAEIFLRNAGFSTGATHRRPEIERRTRMLSMELDHDSGAMDGEVLAGKFTGRRLNCMPLNHCCGCLRECSGPTTEQRASGSLSRPHPGNLARRGWRAPSRLTRKPARRNDARRGPRGTRPEAGSQRRRRAGCAIAAS